MDPSNSGIGVLQEIIDSKKGSSVKDVNPKVPSGFHLTNGELGREGDHGNLSCNGGDANDDDGNDDVPDFDDADLEVLDCWEDVEEANDEGESSDPLKVKLKESIPEKVLSTCSATVSEAVSVPSSKQQLTETCDSGKTKGSEDLKHVGHAETSDHDKSNKVKPGQKVCPKIDHKVSKQKIISPVIQSVVKNHKASSSNDGKVNKSSRKSLASQVPIKKSTETKEKNSSKLGTNLLSDPAETRVDKFLKEMALRHPNIICLRDNSQDVKALEPISSDSSKHSSILSTSGLDPSEFPPGVDMDHVTEDTSTFHLITAGLKTTESKQTQVLSSFDGVKVPSLPEPSRKVSRGHATESEAVKGSPYAKKHNTSYSSRHSRSPPPYRLRDLSPTRSFSLSPSPTPKSRRLSRSPVQYSRVPPVASFNYMTSAIAPGYSDRSQYQSPLIERNRYHRSPAPEPSVLRDLSRSLSRECARHHSHSHSRSRSRSRNRSFVRRRSRSRHRYPSKEDRHRRYRRSSSCSSSPSRRIRSRSRSQSRSHHRYVRKRTPLRDEARSKRPRLSRSISRSRSPWKPPAETHSSEWHVKYPDHNRVPALDEECKLEHDMALFIATNMAATVSRPPPVSNVREWLEPEAKSQDTIPSKIQAIPDPPVDIVDRWMPLPPPPPDISELMTSDEITETNNLRAMSPIPNVSLSSLLESAVTGCPDNIIMDRCQDAIMKLHDVSIKPGRFAVISTIKVPPAEPSSTFQPWQSILNRSLASKINFTLSTPSEHPTFWKLKSSKSNSKETKGVVSSLPSPTIMIPSSSTTSEMDRSALLEKIFFLTRELQEVKQLLDCKMATKQDVGVQTYPVNFCENCGRGKNSMLPSSKQGHTNPTASLTSSAPQINISTMFEPTRPLGSLLQSAPVSQPWSPVQRVSSPQRLAPPQRVRTPQPVPTPQSVSARHPVPAPVSEQYCSKSSVPLVPSNPPGSSSLLGSPPTGVPSHTMNWCSSKQPAMSSGVGGPSGTQAQVSLSLNAQLQHTSGQQSGRSQKNTSIPSLMSLTPGQDQKGAKKAAKQNVAPVKEIPIMPLTTKSQPSEKKQSVPAMTITDYDLSKYLMVGDEHLCDLISYLRSVGFQINFDSKFCYTGQNVDKLLKSLIAAGDSLSYQIILFIGMYDSSYTEKVLCKYKQLVGYLRKRCSHLVLIEPPPIPKFRGCKTAWNSFSIMQKNFGPFSSENVSVVHCSSFLLHNNAPNNALYANPQCLGLNGLQLIAEELQKVIANAKRAKFG